MFLYYLKIFLGDLMGVIYYDIETDDKVKIEAIKDKKSKRIKYFKVKRKGTITSIVLKEQGKEPVAFTIGLIVRT